MKPKEVPDYKKCRKLFEDYLKTEGVTKNSTLDFSPKNSKSPRKAKSPSKARTNRVLAEDSDASDGEDDEPLKVTKQNGEAPKKRGRKPKVADVDTENKVPEKEKAIKKNVKRKSSEPAVLVKVKKTKLNPVATPPAKVNHTNTATQTSIEKLRYSPRLNSSRHVSFDSPISEIVGENHKDSRSINSSGDIFDDSFTIKEVKVKKPRRKLLSNEEVVVKRVVRKKVTAVKKPTRSWKDSPTVVNGRSPPK